MKNQISHKINHAALSKDSFFIIQKIQAIFNHEIASLQKVLHHIPNTTSDLIHEILKTNGRIVFSGMGKSGLIARKLAATFSSMNLPSYFLHPTDALHGDSGLVQKNDLCILLSKSASGSELKALFPTLRERAGKIALISCVRGPLSSLVDFPLSLFCSEEAGEIKTVPTTSCTAMLVFGDALALVASSCNGFSQQKFSELHPAGSIGKTLTLKVSDIMISLTDSAVCNLLGSFEEVILEISKKKRGCGVVVDVQGKLEGIITDGDLRRSFKKHSHRVFSTTAQDIMSANPQTIELDEMGSAALQKMKKLGIASLVVINDNRVSGMIHLHDLVSLGIQ